MFVIIQFGGDGGFSFGSFGQQPGDYLAAVGADKVVCVFKVASLTSDPHDTQQCA